MEYNLTDSSGTNDDLPPRNRKGFQRGRPAAASGNGRAVSGGGNCAQLARFNGNMESQINVIVQEAYYYILRAFNARSDTISWEQQDLISELRKELNVTDDEHRELLSGVNADDTIQTIREWRRTGHGVRSGMLSSQPFHKPSQSVSGSRKKQRTSHSWASLSLGAPSSRMQPSSSVLRQGLPNAKNKKPKTYALPGPGKVPSTSGGTSDTPRARACAETASYNPLIGRKVWTRWPEDNQFYEAVITDYNPVEGRHALVYDMNTTSETWEWVNLKEISPEDIEWEGEDPVVSHRRSHPGTGHGAKKLIGHNTAVSGTGRCRGSIKGHSKNDFQLSQNGIANKAIGDIKLLHTGKLIKEVEKVFEASHPNPSEIDKAEKVLKEQEQALLDAIRRLED